MGVETKEIDLGEKAWQQYIKSAKKSHVAFGIAKASRGAGVGKLVRMRSPSGRGKIKGKLNYAQLMAKHEFGYKSQGKRIPERSVIRRTANELESVFNQIAISGLKSMRPIEGILRDIGEKARNHMVMLIKGKKLKENAQYTIEKKGSSTPLIDLGFLWRSLDYVFKIGKQK